ncbi:MAG TPA: hypothetical protein DHR80_08350, partial [Thalassospira lucentensis]
ALNVGERRFNGTGVIGQPPFLQEIACLPFRLQKSSENRAFFPSKKQPQNDISNACLKRKVNKCLAPAGLKSSGKEKTSETEKVSEVFW